MKTNFIKIILTVIVSTMLHTCSSSDDITNDDDPQSQSNYMYYSITGSAVNHSFTISESQEIENDNITILGHVYNEGTTQVASLVFARSLPGDDFKEIYMTLPTNIGEFALGEIETGSTGNITEEPIFNMKFLFGELYAFYDGDNDGDNDLLTHLLSKNISLTITEYEETYNDFGILTLGHIKGSFEGQAYYKAYTGPTSEPEELLHSVTGSFEYTIPNNNL